MALASAASPLLFGKYQPLRQLGEGGMGRVLLGHCHATGAQVVIKRMHGHLADHPLARASFQRELDIMKRFRHPFAVGMLDGGWDGATPCLVLEYVRGVTLDAYAKSHGRIDPRRVGRWLAQICQVLHAAHGAGILHRDLSLANLMLVDADTPNEQIKVLDFGLARLSGGVYVPLEKLTGDSDSIGAGTPDYLCPEQIRGDSVDARGDLYSVGVVLFKLLTGHLPFEDAEELSDILLAQVHMPAPRFVQFGAGDIPLPLEAVVHLCLAKDPNDRPQTAHELADLYSEALGEEIAARGSFADIDLPPVDDEPLYDAGQVLDRLEAWMPEQIAVMKIRGFVAGVGGEVVSSQSGMLRVRLRDPRADSKPKAGFTWFGWSRNTLSEPEHIHLDLHMTKKQEGTRGLVAIDVVLEAKPHATPADTQMRAGFGQRLCKELRAFLMTGA